MTFQLLLSSVVDLGLCAHCGACAAACPAGALDMVAMTPSFRAGLDPAVCADCRICVDVCPGADTRVPALEAEWFGRGRTAAERWLGIYAEAHSVSATDSRIHAQSSSGGGTTVLLARAMRLLSLDRVLVAGRDSMHPWRAAPEWCTDPAALPQFGQSTYQLSPYLEPLGVILRTPRAHRVGVVGLACHIQAIRAMQALDHPVGERARASILFLVEIACSSSTLPEGTTSLIKDTMGIALDEVASVRYRDHGYPGKFTVDTTAGARHMLPVWRAIRHFKDYKTHRCLSCPDWLSGLADVSVFDGDQNIFRSSQDQHETHEKRGTVLIRTPLGARVFADAVRRGDLNVAPAGNLELDNLGLTRKRNRRAAYECGPLPIPTGPLPGFVDAIVPVADEVLVPLPGSEMSE